MYIRRYSPRPSLGLIKGIVIKCHLLCLWSPDIQSSTARLCRCITTASLWLVTLHFPSWDRNPGWLKRQSKIPPHSHEETSVSKGILNTYLITFVLCTYIRLTATESSIHSKSLTLHEWQPWLPLLESSTLRGKGSIYCHLQIDCFVVSQHFSEVRHTRFSKLVSKPGWLNQSVSYRRFPWISPSIYFHRHGEFIMIKWKHKQVCFFDTNWSKKNLKSW